METLFFEKVRKKYPYEKYFLLDGITFSVKKGQKKGILCERQSGKSTIVKLAADLTKPTEGQILLDGKQLCEIEISKRNICVIFDDFALMNKSVEKNLAYPLKVRKEKDIQNKVDFALKEFCLKEVKNFKPKKLSEGQKLAAVFARASLRNFDFVLFDDIFRHTGKSEAMALADKLLKEKNAGCLFFSSDANDLDFCDSVIVIADGKTLFEGEPSEAENFVKTTKCFNKYETGE